jgi:hypothetical protein
MTFLDRLFGRGDGDLLEQQEQARRIIRPLQEELTPEEVVHGPGAPRGARAACAPPGVLVLKVQQQGVHLFDPPSSPGTSDGRWEAISQRFEKPCPTVDISG